MPLPLAIPVFYVVGASAIAGATAAYAWLSREEWSVDDYNSQMERMQQTIQLWQDLGWSNPGKDKNACWRRHENKRLEWVLFRDRFIKFYGEHGKQSYYLPDAIERQARDFVRELAGWADWLEASCGIGMVKPKPHPDESDGLTNALKWGAILVGGVVVLQLIGSVRSATRYYR
jgi:hypothetical protein